MLEHQNRGNRKMDLQVILTSTVVAAVISTLTSVYNSRRTGNLKYITEERQKWREEIRKIAESIEDCSRYDIKKQLTRLKVRINANGKLKEDSYYEDSHIWNLIHDLENFNICEKCFKNKKQDLINSLSFLLKYDWERQKREVLGTNIDKIRIILTSALLVSVLINGKFDFSVLFCSMSILLPSVFPLLKQVMIRLSREKSKEEFYEITGKVFIIPALVITSLGIYLYMQILVVSNWLIVFPVIIMYSFNLFFGIARPMIAVNIVYHYERNVRILFNESL